MQAQANHSTLAPATTVEGLSHVETQATYQTQSIQPASAASKPQPIFENVWTLPLGIVLCLSIVLAVILRKDARSNKENDAPYPAPSWSKRVSKFLVRHWLVFGAVIGYLVALIVCSYLDPGKGVSHSLIGGVVPFIGTLVGTGAAFLSDRIKEEKRIEDSQVLAINKALSALSAQLNELAILNLAIQEFRNKKTHPINLRALAIPENLGRRVNTDDLAFLIDHRHVQILSDLEIEQRRFDAAFFSLHDRNKLMIDVIQPKAAEAGINGKPMSEEGLVEVFGEFAYGCLMQSTENVIENVPSTVESCPVVMEKLTRIGKELFPHRIILKFDGFKPPPAE